MKAITLTQPWATLVAIGAKSYETRSWKTTYRGPLAIHAAKGFPGWAKDVLGEEPFLGALGQASMQSLDDVRGCVIAIVELHTCWPTTGFHCDAFIREPERSFGDYSPGRYAWQLKKVQRLDEPIPAKGTLGIWEWKPVPSMVLTWA